MPNQLINIRVECAKIWIEGVSHPLRTACKAIQGNCQVTKYLLIYVIF